MGVFAVVLIIAGLFGDFANNTKALTGGILSITPDDTGLVLLAFAIAGMVCALGYAATAIHKGFWVGAGLMMMCSASLTLYAQWGDVESRDKAEVKQDALIPSLLAEKDRLLESLPRCEFDRWCDSQRKEARVSEINNQLSGMDSETGNPGGPWLAYALLFAVSVGAPIGNLFCSSMAATLLKRDKEKKQKPETTKKKTKVNVPDNVIPIKKNDSVKKGVTKKSVTRVTDNTKLLTDNTKGALDAVTLLRSEGKTPSVRNVREMRYPDGSRMVKGTNQDVMAQLHKLAQDGVLVAPEGKGRGFRYEETYFQINHKEGKGGEQ
jgi:hypothetical protein